MEGNKKKFRKSLWLGMAFNGEWGTETPIALTTTTTFTTTTTLNTTTLDNNCYYDYVNNVVFGHSNPKFRNSAYAVCGPRFEGIGCCELFYCNRKEYCSCKLPKCDILDKTKTAFFGK